MEPPVVQKYGGTSVARLEQIETIADHIRRTVVGGQRIVAVVSAMGDYTDRILKTAHSLHSDPPKRELDMLAATGERITASLMSIALSYRGVGALSLTGSQCGILTDGFHGNARIESVLGKRIQDALTYKQVVIIAGFQGVCPKTKDITTLGRGGSDLTAIAIAIALDAPCCEIYTDVDGVFTCDPRLVADAKFISEISWESMGELSWNGAAVLHHRAAFLASKYSLPITIKSSENPDHVGTRVEGRRVMEGPVVTAITFKVPVALIDIEFLLLKGHRFSHFCSMIHQWLWEQEESPQVFQLEQSKSKSSIRCLIHNSLIANFLKLVSDEAILYRLQSTRTSLEQKASLVSLVGQGFRQCPELIDKVYTELAPYGYLYNDLRENVIQFVVGSQVDAGELVQRLHQTIVLGKSSLRA